MGTINSSTDFPLTLISREAEVSQASDVAAANEHVRQFFNALMQDGVYCLEISGESVLLEWPGDVDMAYRLFLASPKINQDYRRMQAANFFHKGVLKKKAA